jgi:DNA invertase Pin-like site-specific DNA recombinase
VAIYARVSTSDKGQDPENQLRQLREWCANSGHTIVHEYVEHVSGAKGKDKRSQFAAMLDDAHKRRFDIVLVWALDRFSREGMKKTVAHIMRLDAAGVKFHSYQEPYLSTSDEMVGGVLLACMAGLAKQERLRHVERITAGMERAREKGTRTGKAIGRPRVSAALEDKIRASLASGNGVHKIARGLHCGTPVVQRIKREMTAVVTQ